MKALLPTIFVALAALASTSVATAGTYEEWFQAIGSARLGEYTPAFKKPEGFEPYETALLANLHKRLGPRATIDKPHTTKWWGRVGERRMAVWGESFRIKSGEFWVVVRRFELPTPGDALALGLHVQHETSAVVQIRGERLIVTESFWRLDMSRDPDRAQAVMTSLWDAWKGTTNDGLRATLLVSGQEDDAHFAGEIHVPTGQAELTAQASAFLRKAAKHPNTRVVTVDVPGGQAFRYATGVELGRSAVSISARTAPAKGMNEAIRRR